MNNKLRSEASIAKITCLQAIDMIDASALRRASNPTVIPDIITEINSWILFTDSNHTGQDARDLQGLLNGMANGHQYSGLSWKEISINILNRIERNETVSDSDKDLLKQFLRLFKKFLDELTK